MIPVEDSHPVTSKAPGSLESDQGLDLWSHHQAAKAGATSLCPLQSLAPGSGIFQEHIHIAAVSLFFFDFRLPRPKPRRHQLKKKQLHCLFVLSKRSNMQQLHGLRL